jgi:hypothetical protein
VLATKPHRVNSQPFRGRNTTATFRTHHSTKTILVDAATAARTAMEGGGGAAREDGYLKVLKIEIFFGLDFEICIISLLVM